MTGKSSLKHANNVKLLIVFLWLLAIALMAILVPVYDWAMPAVFAMILICFAYLRDQILIQTSAVEICDFYAKVHEIENLQIMQNDRPYSRILKTVLDLGRFDWAVLFLMDFDKDCFVAAEAAGIELNRFAPVSFDQIASKPGLDDMTLSVRLLEHAFKEHEFRGALAGTTLVCNHTFYGCMLVGRDDTDSELSEDDNYRLEILSDQISICLHNYRMHKEMALRAEDLSERQTQIQRELEMSRIVQEGVMQRAVPSASGLEVATYSRPARFIGGDFVRFVDNPDSSKLGILVGDVSGKGIPAALVMAVVVCLFNEKASLDKSPDSLLAEINLAMKGFLGARTRFNSSAIWGIFDLSQRRFSYASAGHDFPLHLVFRKNEINELVSTGTLLGIFNESEYHSVEVAVDEGDKIMFYSDGLTDFFEYNLGYADGFVELKKFLFERRTKTSQEIVNEIRQLVENAEGPTKDDITVAVFSIANIT